jgi:glycosyltransferase involved in cell wall biosynthesis
LKILHLLDSLNRGGTETLVLDICRNSSTDFFDLTFAATGGGNLEEDFRASGVDFVRLQRRLPIDLVLAKRLRDVIKKRQIEIVHTHQPVEGIHAYIAALGLKTKVILSYHGGSVDAKNRRTLQFLLPRTAKNVFCSEALRVWYKAERNLNTDQNFTILHNGVDRKRLNGDGARFKQSAKIPADAFLIGMIGNFYAAPRKDQLTLCRALPDVFTKIKNAHCIFVGRIEEGAENKFAECVKFCKEKGFLERSHFLGVRSDVPDILDALDIFVLSTLHEGLPISVLEAMLAGVPCVLSDISPNLEVSNNGEFAEIFPTQNADVLSEKLLQLTKNTELRENLSKKTLDFANQNYSIKAHLEKLKMLYNSI